MSISISLSVNLSESINMSIIEGSVVKTAIVHFFLKLK